MAPTTSSRREPAIVAASWSLVVLLTLVLRGWEAALAMGYVLALVVGLAWGVARALGHPRLARGMAGVLLALAALSPLQPATNPEVLSTSPEGVRFPTSRARAFQEIAPPSDWSTRGLVWAYVGFESEIADVLSAVPVLAVGQTALSLEPAPERPYYLRARVPKELLDGRVIRLSFGFEAPDMRVRLARCVLYESSLDREPSTWSADGRAPPPGPARVPKRRSLLGLLGRGARFELGERWVIELWLLDERGRVLATCI